MTDDELARHPAVRALRAVLIDLSLVSHVSGASYDASPGAKRSGGGARPPGGPDGRGDREEAYRQKTALHFARRFERLRQRAGRSSDERVAAALASILEDARAALQDWRKAPRSSRPRPEDLTDFDKAQIASDVRGARSVADEWGVSHTTVLRYRRRYSNPVRLRREAATREVELVELSVPVQAPDTKGR